MRVELMEGREINAPPEDFPSLKVDGRIIETDTDGFLLDIADWNRQVAETMAAKDSVDLTDEHWILIDFLHRFYREYQIAPEMPVLSRNLCKDRHDCHWTRSYIKRLFPDGAKSACRYAGLPAPVGRSCG